MAYIPSSGSVVAFQGTDPWIITGSVQAAITPAANQSVSGTVQTDAIGSVATVIIGGSIAASFTPPANQSVSGTVGASVIGHAPVVIVGGSILTSSTPNQSVSGTVNVGNFPANQSISGTVNVGGSVVAFQGAGWSGSVASFPKGTIITSLVSTVPSSVIVGASIFGLAPVNVTNTNLNIGGSVASFWQGNASVITVIQGSVAAQMTPAANQSVSGTVQTDVRGSVAVAIISGSVAVATGNSSVWVVNTNTSVSGTITANQGTWSGSVAAIITNTTLNVSGSVAAFQAGTRVTSLVSTVPSSVIVGASIFGLPPVNVTNTNLNVSGSVAAWLQSTNASVITVGTPAPNQSVSGTVDTRVIASVATVIIGGSIAASFTPPANQSVSGTVGASVIGTVPVTQGGTWIASVFGNMSVLGTVPVTQSGAWTTSVVGTVATTQSGTWISSVVNTVPSSMLVGASIIGLTPISGTVTANQGTGFGSIAAHIKSGSVIAVLGGNTSVLVAGAPSVINYVARNDTVASFLGADLAYRVAASDSAGRLLVKPFTSEDNTIISYVGSLVSASVTLIQASVTGKKAYVTDMWLSNSGATTAVVTIKDGASNNMGQFIVPTGGGSNSPGIAIPLKTAVTSDLLWQPSASSSILYLTLKGYLAP